MALSPEDKAEIAQMLAAAAQSNAATLEDRIAGMFDTYHDGLMGQLEPLFGGGESSDDGVDPNAVNTGVDPAAGYDRTQQVIGDERIAQLEAAIAQEQAAREEAEFQAMRTDAHNTIKTALAAKGISGARARAVIADFEQNGTLTLDPKSGEPVIVVSRARGAGKRPEALMFTLEEGVNDWFDSDDAQEFIPARMTGRDLAGDQQSGSNGVRAGGSLAGRQQQGSGRRTADHAQGNRNRINAPTTESAGSDPVSKTLDQLADAGVNPDQLNSILFSES